MLMNIQGDYITIQFQADEGQPDVIQLPDGYSFEKIRIISITNITFLIPYMQIVINGSYTFPAVNSKSPCYIKPIITDVTKESELKFIIEKFGQIPDTHYFDKAFEPISVTGDDGKEYKVIPSDQFK